MDGLCSSCLLEARLVGCYTINSSIGDFTEIHVFELWCCRYVFDWWEVIPTVPLAMGYKLASHCNSLIYHRRFRLIYQLLLLPQRLQSKEHQLMTGTKLKPPSRNGSFGYDNLLPEFGSSNSATGV
ncbi:hypothetical protein BDE02_01G374200 [Populus trichocarpa]|nr:hypothetical protein BDE02_01G374200 [Populus trichocarpa]KAI5605772.1 hypothetical protein BDE02_01G374200 [Populus trichocarpa]KAI5605773.1 hypothetical protein BDE02_01G374200 [Populus trichocarpa]KAI5605774.1 hypothetical protein BDE02_01G374200 [Populus trichocarpa]